MDDFDSFSTVVQKDAPQQKDDFDSFSSVVDAPKKPAAAPAKKKGWGQQIDEKLEEGKSNFKREIKSPGAALAKLGLGVARGVSDIAEGGMQFGANNVREAARFIAPDSTLVKKMDEFGDMAAKDMDTVEAKYQDLTKGSVFAGGGRVVGNVVAPGGAISKTGKGASLAVKAGRGAVGGAAIGAAQPVRGEDRENYAQTKGMQVAVGAGLGLAAPVVAKGALEGASKLGSKKAEQILTNQRADRLFHGNKSAKADAEVITELGGMNHRIGDRQMLTGELNARSKKLADETHEALKEAGATKPELAAFRNWQGLTEAERRAMAETPTGKAAAAMISKLDRIRGLTPGELSTRSGAVVRGGLDLMPIPTALRNGLRTTLGGRVTRAEMAHKLLDNRTQRAAAQFTERNGASEATQGLQSLQAMAKAKVDAKAALERAKQAAKDAAAAKAAQDAAANAGSAKALALKARKISSTPGGGAYQALLEHTGLASRDLNAALRIAQKVPEAADAIRAIRVGGGNTKEGAIYPVTDIVKSIADKMGMQRGALTQGQSGGGVLSDVVEPLTAKYQMAAKVRQKTYDDIATSADNIGSTQTREAVRNLAQKLKSTPKNNERIKLIDDLEKNYPEAAGLFNAARHFK